MLFEQKAQDPGVRGRSEPLTAVARMKVTADTNMPMAVAPLRGAKIADRYVAVQDQIEARVCGLEPRPRLCQRELGVVVQLRATLIADLDQEIEVAELQFPERDHCIAA